MPAPAQNFRSEHWPHRRRRPSRFSSCRIRYEVAFTKQICKTRCPTGSTQAARPANSQATASRKKSAFQTAQVMDLEERRSSRDRLVTLDGRPSHALARIIHKDFYCNRRHAAATSLTAGGLAAQSINILFQVCLLPSRLRAPVSRGVSAVS